MTSRRAGVGPGLSPRLRGNRDVLVQRHVVVGSIPAPAGEPPPKGCLPVFGAVYPRACGGTSTKDFKRKLANGLSPRLRGNPKVYSVEAVSPGSIPAPAGEPWAGRARCPHERVYPRACGGTACGVAWWPPLLGLSPRLRGNHRPHCRRIVLPRSIPAPAGEPTLDPNRFALFEVYPRACGGTACGVAWWPPLLGLSPRLRGNHRPHCRRIVLPRSIPAPAGEPTLDPNRFALFEVYPRACGGTVRPCLLQTLLYGLSPRLRGNLHECTERQYRFRSIPAPAGEPCS